MITAAIITLSDRCSRGDSCDISGPLIKKILETTGGYDVCSYTILPDDQQVISETLKACAETLKPNIIFTTGGTGFGPRDTTPEATLAICGRLVPGIPELIRAEGVKKTKHAALSRGIAGICGTTLIINLPGSPKGVEDSLAACIGILPHAVKMLCGGAH